MDPQKDYAGKNTYKKTTRDYIETSSGGPKSTSPINGDGAQVNSPIQNQNQNYKNTDVFSKRNIIAYYAVMLFTVGGVSGNNSILGDIFLSFLAVLLSILVGVASMPLLLFSLELFGFRYLASKAKDKSDVLIPLLGYVFMFATMYSDVIF